MPRSLGQLSWYLAEALYLVLSICLPEMSRIYHIVPEVHNANAKRWIWSISECNLMTGDSRSWPPKGGPTIRERRGSGPEQQKPKHNPCWPVGRNWRKPIVLTIDLIEWNQDIPKGYATMHVIGPFCPHDLGHSWEHRKNQTPAYSVSDKGPHDRLKPKWCFNLILWILLVGITHHKPLP